MSPIAAARAATGPVLDTAGKPVDPRHNFEMMCQILYGSRWQIALAAACKVSARQVRRWQRRPEKIDGWVLYRLRILADERRAACESAAVALAKYGFRLGDKPKVAAPVALPVAGPETPNAGLGNSEIVARAAASVAAYCASNQQSVEAAVEQPTSIEAPPAPVETVMDKTVNDEAAATQESTIEPSAPEPEVMPELKTEAESVVTMSPATLEAYRDYLVRGHARQRIMSSIGIDDLLVGDEIYVGSRTYFGGTKKARVARRDGTDVYIRIEYGKHWRKESLLETAKFCGFSNRAGLEAMVNALLAEDAAKAAAQSEEAAHRSNADLFAGAPT